LRLGIWAAEVVSALNAKLTIDMKKKNQVALEATNTGISRQGLIDSGSVMEVFRWIYLEARKELKKNEKINTTVLTRKDSCSLRFVSDDLDLQLIIKEGGPR
jgi:hypothetical protein